MTHVRPSPSQRSALGPSLSRSGGEGHIAAPEPGRETLLVYRHRLAPLSEVGFLRRCYIGFEHLDPVWLGCHIDAGVNALTDEPLRLGRAGAPGRLDRMLFRHF